MPTQGLASKLYYRAMSPVQSTAQFSSYHLPIPCSRRPALSIGFCVLGVSFHASCSSECVYLPGHRRFLISLAKLLFILVNEHLAPTYLPTLLASFLARISGSANVPPHCCVQNRPAFIAKSTIALTAPKSSLHAHPRHRYTSQQDLF